MDKVESLKKSIKRLEKKAKNIETVEIKQAEENLASVMHLESSPDARERLKFQAARLELATLVNTLANTRVLITLKQEEILELNEKASEKAYEKQ